MSEKVKNNITEMVFILDRSGSMAGMEKDTIGGFNSMIERQRKLEGKFLKRNELREIRYHDLRHTSASLLLNKGKGKGITLKDVQIWLGHSDFATTANIYAHLDATSKMISMNVMTGLVTA